MEDFSCAVVINSRIPWLTKASYYLLILCLIAIVLCGLYMIPSTHSSDEMKAAYFVLTTPEYIKVVSVIVVLGTPTFFILYRYARIKRKAVLRLFSDRLELETSGSTTSILINDITNIACNDALTTDGSPKGKLTIDLKDKNRNVRSVTLVDYSQSEEIMQKLLKYENIKFEVTNFPSNPQILDQ